MYGSADVSMFRLGGAAGVLFVVQSLGGGGCFALKARIREKLCVDIGPNSGKLCVDIGPNSGKNMC